METPPADLVQGMTWLQPAFALRFTRFGKETGQLCPDRTRVVSRRMGVMAER